MQRAGDLHPARLENGVVRTPPGYAEAFRDTRAIRYAVNQEYVEATHPVTAGDEVAFFPPVTGG